MKATKPQSVIIISSLRSISNIIRDKYGFYIGETEGLINFHNDTFLIHKECNCGKCSWCLTGPESLGAINGGRAPNFWHKESGFRAWINGNEVEINMDIGNDLIFDIIKDCIKSL